MSVLLLYSTERLLPKLTMVTTVSDIMYGEKITFAMVTEEEEKQADILLTSKRLVAA
jgi:hypothetical protein